MTINEKRKIVSEYCGNTSCLQCRLANGEWENPTVAHNCPWIHESPESDLDKALELIGYNNDEKPTDCEVGDKMPEKTDAVNHPSHYTDGKIEVIEFIEDKKLGFCLGNAVKYIARAGKKDPTKEVEDLKKARWYIERRIKQLEEVNNAEC